MSFDTENTHFFGFVQGAYIADQLSCEVYPLVILYAHGKNYIYLPEEQLLFVYVGDVLFPRSVCMGGLEKLEKRYGISYRALDWNHGGIEDLRTQNRIIENEGPSAVNPPEAPTASLSDAQVLIVHFCPVSFSVIQTARKLRLICTLLTGTSDIDVKAAKELGIDVVNLPGRLADAFSDLTIGVIFAVVRGIAWARDSLRKGVWPQDSEKKRSSSSSLEG